MIDVDLVAKLIALIAIPVLAGLAVEIIVAQHRAERGRR